MSHLRKQSEYEKTFAYHFFRWLGGETDSRRWQRFMTAATIKSLSFFKGYINVSVLFSALRLCAC